MGMFCEKCDEYRLALECRCKQFEVDHDGEIWNVYALNESGAAEAFAKNYNENGDHPLMGETEIVIINGKKFEVSAEPDIYYSVEELDDEA